MPKKRDLENIKKELATRYPDQVFDFTNYQNTHSKILVIDPDYGKWYPTVHNLLQKPRQHRERYLAGQRVPKTSLETVREKISSVYGNAVSIDESTYKGVSRSCRFVDKEYGEFFTSPAHVFHGHGHRQRGILKFSKSNQLPIQEVKQRLFEQHAETVTIDESTYNGLYRHARFTHKIYGDWNAIPSNVLKGSSHPSGTQAKIRQTTLRKYGVLHALQSKEIFEKATRNRWRTIDLTHWKTNDSIVCRGSYEYAVVRFLNRNQIDYDWQIKIQLTDSMVYFVDLYLVAKDRFVEIKGYFFSPANKQKWDLFHKQHKNSEIWFGNKVSEITGKSLRKIKEEFNFDCMRLTNEFIKTPPKNTFSK